MHSSSLRPYIVAVDWASTGLPLLSIRRPCPAAAKLPRRHRAGRDAGAAALARRPARRPRARARRLLRRRRRAAASDGAQATIGGVPAYTVGNAVTVVTGEELRAPAGAPCRRRAAQPAGRCRQPQRRHRQPHAGAHPRRRGQSHAGADRRHRGQQHRRRRVRLLQSVGRGHRAHRGDPRPHERPLRLQRGRRRHQHHHPPGPGALAADRCARRPARSARATSSRARPAAATRPTSRRLLPLARHRRFQHRAVRRRARRLAHRHASRCAAGRSCCPA